jgi:hypothetical protein
MKMLIGHQLALLPEVLPYLVSNPAVFARYLQPLTTCPVGQSYGTAEDSSSSPEQLTMGLYQIGQEILTSCVGEESPDYTQRPSSPEQAFAIGDEVRILAVQEHQSKRWVGQRGVVNRLSRKRVWVKLRGLTGGKPVELLLPVDCLEKLPTIRRQQQRRYSPKGKASGWLEERQGNKKRKTPSTSYYYGWLDGDTCRKRYVPAGKLHRVHEMINQRKPVSEILSFLGVQQAPADHD